MAWVINSNLRIEAITATFFALCFDTSRSQNASFMNRDSGLPLYWIQSDMECTPQTRQFLVGFILP